MDITATVLNIVCRVLGEKWKGEESLAALGLLAILLLRVLGLLEDRLGEVLVSLVVLRGAEEGKDGCSLVPTNLPHLHFTQTANSDPDLKRHSCPDTSKSDMSDGEKMGTVGDFNWRRQEALVQKETLYTWLSVCLRKYPNANIKVSIL